MYARQSMLNQGHSIQLFFLLSKKARIILTSIQVIIRIHQKDSRNQITGVNPPIVTFEIDVRTPMKKKIINGTSSIL
jgi:hypothetical protein